MTFYHKIEELCKNKGTTVTALAIELGFSNSAGTTWKNLKNNPSNSTVKKVADYFGVTVDYLTNEAITTDTAFNTVNGNHNIIGNGNTVGASLTEHQKVLLELFDKMDVIKQAQLLAYVAELAK